MVTIFLFLLMGCAADVNDANDYEPSTDNYVYEPITTEANDKIITTPTALTEASPPTCFWCDALYDEGCRRQAVSSLYLRNMWRSYDTNDDYHSRLTEFLLPFENIHTFTHIETSTDWHAVLVFWPDEPLQDFSFVLWEVAMDPDQGWIITGVRDVLYTADALQPSDAFVLNVAFAHYQFPVGGFIFMDESGAQQRLVVQESMATGDYYLSWRTDY